MLASLSIYLVPIAGYVPSLLNSAGDDECHPTRDKSRIVKVLSLTGTVFALVQPLLTRVRVDDSSLAST